MTDPLKYFEYCPDCGLIWDANLSAYENSHACPFCAYIETTDELFDTKNELEEMENERDDERGEREDAELDRDSVIEDNYLLEGKLDRFESDLSEAQDRIKELEQELRNA